MKLLCQKLLIFGVFFKRILRRLVEAACRTWFSLYRLIMMWSALQVIHKASDKAREYNYFMGGISHSWIEYYDRKIESDRSCLNEWHAMDNLESRRPPSPDCFRSRPKEREITEKDIREKLKEIMMTVDLDEVTSKYIRTRLEDALDMDLNDYKSFIDQEMITILGQMDKATKIYDFLYLGSEWNASNLEELQRNGVGHILNVTQEIDNFFPGMFDYMNVRVYDDEGTELLRHWDSTFKFINGARHQGSKVLVHCKMGVSRSASVVIAYAMKEFNLNMQEALKFVKNLRTCIKPNGGFMRQLETYQGILHASKHRNNLLWRSRSESDLKCTLGEVQSTTDSQCQQDETEMKPELASYLETPSHGSRPKSWSPDDNVADMLFPGAGADGSSDSVNTREPEASKQELANSAPSATSRFQVLMRSEDAKSYSVSPNKALHLPLPSEQSLLSTGEECDPGSSSHPVHFQIGDDDSPTSDTHNNPVEWTANDVDDNGGSVSEHASQSGGPTVHRVSSIKDRINELESHVLSSVETKSAPIRRQVDLPENTGIVLNLTNQFECVSKSTPSSPIDENTVQQLPFTPSTPQPDMQGNEPVLSQTKPPAPRHQAVLVRPETWNDGNDGQVSNDVIMRVSVNSQLKQLTGPSQTEVVRDEKVAIVGTTLPSDSVTRKREDISSTGVSAQVACKQPDPFSDHVDRVFDREELTRVARADSWSSCDSHPPHLEGVVGHKYGPLLRTDLPPSWSTTVPEDCALKRTSSFDLSLPLHHPSSLPDVQETGSVADMAFPPGNAIQRSQSLRTSTSSSKSHSNVPCPPDYRLHGPRPYTGPGERKTTVEKVQPWSTALNSDSCIDSSAHYASAPTLFRSNPQECDPEGPLHSASQPNITYPGAVPGQPMKSRSDLRLNLDAGRNPLTTSVDKVPLSGIVKQQRDAIEGRSAPVVSQHQPLDRKISSTDEGKQRLQSDIQKPTSRPQKSAPVVSPPLSVPSPLDNSEDGMVKRMTREMEAKGITPGATVPLAAVTPLDSDGQLTDKLIIVDQFGKEVPTAAYQGCVTATQECTLDPAPRPTRSPMEEKSVRSLVGKFEIKEQPTPRQRYFSETEVTDRSFSSATAPPTVSSDDEVKDSTCSKNVRVKDSGVRSSTVEPPPVATTSCHLGFKNIVLSRSRPPAVAKVSSESNFGQLPTGNTQPSRKCRKLQGKSHPLTRLQNQQTQRHSSPLYNTM